MGVYYGWMCEVSENHFDYITSDTLEEMENMRRCIERLDSSDIKLHLLNLLELANEAIYLSGKDEEKFKEALENPPEPNAELVQAIQKHHEVIQGRPEPDGQKAVTMRKLMLSHLGDIRPVQVNSLTKQSGCATFITEQKETTNDTKKQ